MRPNYEHILGGGKTVASMYPVGTILVSVHNTNPADYLEFGTWVAWGSGKVPVGVDLSDADFNVVEKTGGEKTHTLVLAEMPSHNHTFTGAKHTHSFSATSGNQSANHTHSLNSHTHSVSITTNSAGGHVHSAKRGNTTYASTEYVMNTGNYDSWGIHWEDASGQYAALSAAMQTAGAHTHSVSGTTGGSSGNTGANSANHTHSVSGTTGEATQGGTVGNSGSGTAHNNVQPYITCYMWKRTA